ncbi:HCP-like protein [Backusella circina FSU 941]|nr:HCP-like protein [Backusella circina FSU 941]
MIARETKDGVILTVDGTRRCLEGDPDALYDVGTLYMDIGIYSKAMKWFLKAPDHADALKEIGYLYMKGLGVKVNGAAALEYLQRSAKKGNVEALVDIGMVYLQGYGLPTVDHKKAMEYFKMAAEKGSATGTYNIGYMYQSGNGAPQDYAKAMKWYLKAADKGDSVACNNIGLMYKNGFGVPANVHTALQWYKKAADKNLAIAQFNLANTYEYNEEVRNLTEADYWYRVASENGFVLPQEVINQAQQIQDSSDNQVESKATTSNDTTNTIQQDQLSTDFENKLNFTTQKQAVVMLNQTQEHTKMKKLGNAMQRSQGSAHNHDFYYDSPNDDSDRENDINYDST